MQNADIQTNVLIAIAIVFICLASAGLLIYTVFFAINKHYFRKEINLIKKWNNLLNGLKGINIYKIQVLDEHDIGNKLEFKKYIAIYKQLKENAALIEKNIYTAQAQLNAFNLKIAKQQLTKIDLDLDKALANLDDLKATYDRYTQYGTSIQAITQNYREIYEALWLFWETNVEYHNDFLTINTLFAAIKKTFQSIPKLSNEFDYKTTVNTIVDLSSKLKTIANAIITIYRFQVVDVYFRTTKDYNEGIINDHYEEIDPKDLQSLQNLVTVFNHTYHNYAKSYHSLKLGKARGFAISAINAINQINQFTQVHISTPVMITSGVNEIKNQTDNILASKNEIINSIKDLKQYFVLEPKITQHFDVIEKNVNNISNLNNLANNVKYSTHSEKIKAIRELNAIGNNIVDSKQEIITSIDTINTVLSKIIRTVTDLNDMYIYFWQLLAFIKQVGSDNEETTKVKKIIKSSLDQIEQYSKEIVANEEPDFDKIAYELTSIIEQGNQIYRHITNAYFLKAYANKLFIYANRYKKYKDLKKEFDESNKLYKAKKYDECIDQLLKIIRISKRHKKTKEA